MAVVPDFGVQGVLGLDHAWQKIEFIFWQVDKKNVDSTSNWIQPGPIGKEWGGSGVVRIVPRPHSAHHASSQRHLHRCRFFFQKFYIAHKKFYI